MIRAFVGNQYRNRHFYLLLIAFIIIYFATAELGLHYAFHETNATPVWAPAGISLVILLLAGYKYWPAIFLGGFLVNLHVLYSDGFSLQTVLPIALFTGIGNTLEALAGAYLIRRFSIGNKFLQTLKNTRVFIFYGAFVAALLSAVIGTTVFCGFTNNWSVYIQMLLVWWFGDAMGILIMAPLLIFWGKWNFKNWQWSQYLEFLFYIFIVSFFAFIIYKTNYPVKFLLVPLLVWCIFRFGKFASFITITLVCAFVVWANSHGVQGQGFAHFKSVMIFQLYFGSIAFTFLLVSASLDEQKKSKTLLIESTNLIQNLIDNTSSLINVVDTEGKLLLVNNAFLKHFDQSKENLIGFKRESFMPKEIAEAHRKIDMQIIEQKKPISFDENNAESEGTQYYHTNKFPLYDRVGKIYAVCGVSTDITELKLAEKKLHESNYRNKILFDYAPIPIWEEDFSIVKMEMDKLKAKGIKDFAVYFDKHPKNLKKLTALIKIIAVNRKSLEFYEVEDVIQLNSTLNDWFIEESWQVFKNELISMISGETKYETEIKIKTPKGEQKYLFLSLNIPPDSYETWERVFVSFVDITERKEAEKQLRESEEKFKQAFKTTPDSININRLSDGVYININDGFTRIMEYDEKEVVGKSSLEINIWQKREDREYLVKELKEKGYINNFESTFVSKNGIIKNGLMSAVTINFNGVQHILSITRDITERKVIERELGVYREQLENLVKERTEKLEEQSLSLKESQDALLFLLEDINESRDQLAIANEKLQESNNELEAFTYSVSHDLKAPLRAIDGFSKFLLEDYSEKLDSEGVRLLNVIRDNTKKMDTLILDLLNLSRIGKTELNLHEINMSQFVKNIVRDLISEEEKQHLNIQINSLYSVGADVVLLKQVWLNLLTNAIKFTKNAEKPEIVIGAEIADKFINYYVKDNGVGFNPEYKDKLFGVFQRLHKAEDFEGTGVGLAIVKRIIKRHGGKVWAESEEGKGATFYFSLPQK